MWGQFEAPVGSLILTPFNTEEEVKQMVEDWLKEKDNLLKALEELTDVDEILIEVKNY